MFIHDTLKVMYVGLGYLPNYPYYLISDSELIEAFRKDDGFFNEYYPCPSDDLWDDYYTLKEDIWNKLDAYLNSGGAIPIPNWVYSYMLMRPITYQSDELNIAYLYDLTGVDPKVVPLTEFSPELAEACLRTSKEWMKKRPSQYRDRPPTMFGETHVTKCLRLKQANILIEAEGA